MEHVEATEQSDRQDNEARCLVAEEGELVDIDLDEGYQVARFEFLVRRRTNFKCLLIDQTYQRMGQLCGSHTFRVRYMLLQKVSHTLGYY